jgi:hypothetical protein
MNFFEQPSDSTFASTSLPNYIDFHNDPIIPLPGLATHTLMYCFPLQANYDQLLTICNERLNFSPLKNKVRYFPLTSSVIMVLSDMQKACTLDKSYKKFGLLREVGVQVFIPVVECKIDSHGEWAAHRIMAFIPYIFIDNPMSNIIGREHIGFPKNMARFNMPSAPFQAAYFDVNAYGFQRFDEQNPQFSDYFPWLSIRKKSAGSTDSMGKWTSHREAWAGIKNTFDRVPTHPQFVKHINFYAHELEDMFKAEIHMIFLKQFRDVAEPEKACYQAINEAPGLVESVNGGWFLDGDFEVTFHDMDSYPIKTDLGLPNTSTVTSAFWIDADLKFGTGRTIWKES